MKVLSIVFSFRNEEKNIPELIKRVSSVLKNLNDWKYELIFVNDDSSDYSEKILEESQKSHPIKIINMSRKFGTGPCVLAGLKHAKGDAIIYMDSDLQDPPEIIPDLIKKFENGFEVVHTKRTNRLGESKIRMFLTKIAYLTINKTSNIPLEIDSGDFKLLSKKVLNHINSLSEFNPYIRGLSVWVGYKQTHVEYVRQARFSGKSKFSNLFSGPISQFVRGVTAFSTSPLYLGIIFGLLIILLSILLAIYAFYAKFSGIAIPGSSGILIAICFFSGSIITFLGIIGIYIARIYEQTQGRPRYIIKNIIDQKKND
tara:strand:- start:2054 stop:2995 length:942 start_codon:yes stop_codon:yes gene_type:complete